MHEPQIIVSLFDFSGTWSEPYRKAGYPVIQLDILTGTDIRTFDYQQIPQGSVLGILAALPCTDFSKAGSSTWAKKDADGRTKKSIELAHRTMDFIDYHRPAWWCLENPEGRLDSLVPRIARHRIVTIYPHDFGEPYKKPTVLYGHFCPFFVRTSRIRTQMEVPKEGILDKYLREKYRGLPRNLRRSITPPGFAQAFFDSNP